MKISKISLALLAVCAAYGVDHLFLIPQQNADKISDKASKEVFGDLGTAMETAEGLAMLGDPAILPDATTTEGTALINALLQFTQRMMTAASEQGFTPVEGATWNENVEALAEWLKIEEPEAVAEAVVETPTAEQVAEPLTSEEAIAVAEAIAETPEGEEALENAVAVAEAETGLAMTEEAAIAFLSGKQILNAQVTSRQMVGVAEQKVNDAVEALLDAAKLLRGSGALSDAIIAKLESAQLPETVDVA